MSPQTYVEYLSETVVKEEDIPQRHPVRLFADHWRELGRDGSIPVRRDFSPVKVPALLPYLVVHELIQTEQGPDLMTRLEGEFYVSLNGKTNRGHSRRRVMNEERFQMRLKETQDALETGIVRFSLVELLDSEKKYHKVFRAVFPFRSNGSQSEQVFVVLADENTSL
ncbi:PAS domain-containing protein [Emcibacter nanhaiensis]|uniref:PAS domain-containing protein n=1 Tax=Emcibacter nanhaiensis TaxID=1505037 RepID=A0A501PFH7_9PROT|nr:PAS domain-containing protein [Emcibacter nanhaiensis]TPD59173.1 hypothetical protein FIV46_13170 [Emcibacter nanhaiensis]